MRFAKGVIAAALAVSMTSAPVLAQTAAPLSFGSRAGAAMQGGNALISEREQLLVAAVLFAVLAAAILLSNEQEGDDLGNPVSP